MDNEEDQIFVDSMQGQLNETRQKLSELQSAQYPFVRQREIRDLKAKAERLLKLINLSKQEGVKPAPIKPDDYRTRIAKRIFKFKK